MIITKAYTLLELMLVSALIALLIVIAVPSRTYMNGMRVRSDIETLKACITYVHYCALGTGQDKQIVFDVANNTYSYEGITRALSPGVLFGYRESTKGPPSKSVSELTTPCTFEEHTLVCFRHGSMRAGVIYMSDERKEHMYALSVAVDGASSMRTYRFDQQWMLLK